MYPITTEESSSSVYGVVSQGSSPLMSTDVTLPTAIHALVFLNVGSFLAKPVKSLILYWEASITQIPVSNK